jgi:GDP-D-mannose dehydratase
LTASCGFTHIMYSQSASMASQQKPETFMLSTEAQRALPHDAQVALQQVDNRKCPVKGKRECQVQLANPRLQSSTSLSQRQLTGNRISIFDGSSFRPASMFPAYYGTTSFTSLAPTLYDVSLFASRPLGAR